MVLKWIVDEEKDFLSLLKKWGFSPSLSSYLYHHPQYVKVNQKDRDSIILKVGDEVEITLEEENKDYGYSSNPISILYEDDYILIVDKPKNIASMPTRLHYDNNLCSDVSHYLKTQHIPSKIHMATRLDYETSGIVIFAKHGYIHDLLMKTKIDKYYLLTVHGIMKEDGVINLPILKDPNDKKRRIIDENGKPAITEYKVLSCNENQTQIQAKLITGRTHQLRLHFSYLNHPIVGDHLYGDDEGDLLLDCVEVSFIHPITKEKITTSKKLI